MRTIQFVALVIMIIFLVQIPIFYRGIYIAPPVSQPDYLAINVDTSLPVEINDTIVKGSGTVLIDLSHSNNFTSDDINYLLSRIIERGYDIDYFRGSSKLKSNLSASTSFVVITPSSSFSNEDAKYVKEYVDGGGRLLMLSEPFKKTEINSLAAEFGILFWNDYLYNMKVNDGNFRNIYLTDFTENNITKGLNKIVFYTSSSVFGNGMIFTDKDTYSSSKGQKGRFSTAVLSEDSRVLAIGDVTFLSEPYNVMDNNRLIYNIADFLAPQGAASSGIPQEYENMTNATQMGNITG